MPTMSGWVLASRMEAAMPGIKVLFMSGYSEEVIGRRRLNDCGATLLQKPFTPWELAWRVRAVLES
jgi:DNA-binding response OmpR family regulator